jgi:alkanesulfonate monooxygenase SsuD/methylene tetrahydromethanopterin reductase-like flavin-dependent oxidoreductase (luciferase family)
MRVGVTLFAQNHRDWPRFLAAEAGDDPSTGPEVPDESIYDGELHLGRLAEPLGFDSLWTVEHHFTPYTMVTNPLQFLAYFAGCTEEIGFGTMVVVSPWHDPIRVAEGIIGLELMLQGRPLTIGLGRGAGRREFGGLRVSMDESREMFAEQLDVLRLALTQEWFSYHGRHYDIPRTSLRPRPRADSTVLDRLHCAWGSPSTIPIAASAGLRPLFIPQKDWASYAGELAEYDRIRSDQGFDPAAPTIVVWVYCADTEEEAREGAHRYLPEYVESLVHHYELTGRHFSATKDYDYYARLSSYLRSAGADEMTQMYLDNHVWGTPEQCHERLMRIVDVLGPDQFICAFRYGAMPEDVAERSMRLFAAEVLPALQMSDDAPVGELR